MAPTILITWHLSFVVIQEYIMEEINANCGIQNSAFHLCVNNLEKLPLAWCDQIFLSHLEPTADWNPTFCVPSKGSSSHTADQCPQGKTREAITLQIYLLGEVYYGALMSSSKVGVMLVYVCEQIIIKSYTIILSSILPIYTLYISLHVMNYYMH